MRRMSFLPVIIPICLMGQLMAQIPLKRLNGPVIMDGLSNERAWKEIQPLPMTMYTPTYLGQPSEQTEVRIAYDDEFLYISGRFYDSDLSGVQANSVVRDVDRGGDFMNVFLDTFNDKQNMAAFLTTPAGNRLDAEIINDAEGEIPWNLSWNTYWDCEVVQNPEGWFAEMRIPFSSLRFQDDHGRVVFGLIVHRLISRKNERLIFPAIRPKKPLSAWKASEAQEVVLEGIYRTNPIYFAPYALAGNQYSTLINDSQTGFDSQETFSKEAGLDLKYALANNMTLDITANTDFAQVESDDQQINLTRYSLFYPEKRQFFQERSGIFEFTYAGVNRLFHTRKIGLTDDGKPVRILGGARLVGRVGGWDLGLLDMHTDKNYGLPSENYNVLRFRRNVFNQDSYVGVMETGRFGSDGSYNIDVGFDGNLRLSDVDYLSSRLVQGYRNTVKNKSLLDQSVLNINWERRTTEGLGGNFTGLYVGDYYDPGVGFNLRKGVTAAVGTILYGWFENDSRLIRKHTPVLAGGIFLRNNDHSIESGVLYGAWTVDFKSGASILVQINSLSEGLRDTLKFSENASVLPGNYKFYDAKIAYTMSPGLLLRANLNLEGGTFYDGDRFSASVTPTWNVSRFLELGGEFQFNRIRFSSRDEQLNAKIIRFRVQGAFNPSLSVIALTQYNSNANIVGNSLRLRYNFREGIDAFLVYNNVLYADRQRNGFTLPATDNSTFILKYVHTFIP